MLPGDFPPVVGLDNDDFIMVAASKFFKDCDVTSSASQREFKAVAGVFG